MLRRCVQPDQLPDYRPYTVFSSLYHAASGEEIEEGRFCFANAIILPYKSTMPVIKVYIYIPLLHTLYTWVIDARHLGVNSQAANWKKNCWQKEKINKLKIHLIPCGCS